MCLFYHFFLLSDYFTDKKSLILLDQMRTIDKTRLVKNLGILDDKV
ncbi:MAG: type II toxin-antitoxin system PemK/MazF family toxin [Methyloprofundus sp.]|nr:type II toxin-antitoxin system PemK/MazF family toxin [Methyloprofundus sp.]